MSLKVVEIILFSFRIDNENLSNPLIFHPVPHIELGSLESKW